MCVQQREHEHELESFFHKRLRLLKFTRGKIEGGSIERGLRTGEMERRVTQSYCVTWRVPIVDFGGFNLAPLLYDLCMVRVFL